MGPYLLDNFHNTAIIFNQIIEIVFTIWLMTLKFKVLPAQTNYYFCYALLISLIVVCAFAVIRLLKDKVVDW
jgi:hypothetical protein